MYLCVLALKKRPRPESKYDGHCCRFICLNILIFREQARAKKIRDEKELQRVTEREQERLRLLEEQVRLPS